MFDLFFLNATNLICQGTDIPKYFRESLGLQGNESRLYHLATCVSHLILDVYLAEIPIKVE